MADTFVYSGARARFSVDGRVIGFASNVSGTESIEHEPVETLEVLEVREFVPTAYRCSLNANIFRQVGNSLKQQQIVPLQDNILSSGELTCKLEDKLTGKTVAQFFGCKAQEKSFDVTARGIVSESLSFVAIRVKDESEIS